MFEYTKRFLSEKCREKGIPYLAVCVRRDHELLYKGIFGDGREPTDRDERMFMYSCTKPVTMVGFARLIEQGVLKLDDPVEKYLPEFRDLYLLDEKGNRVAPRVKMTLEHLATMTAGLSYDCVRYDLYGENDRLGGRATTRQLISKIPEQPLLFEPGTRFEYSLCHDVLAAVIEEATGKKFHQYIEETVLSPLKMERSGFRNYTSKELCKQYREENGRVVEDRQYNWLIFSPEYDSGGAGLISCLEDYSRFGDMLACSGESEDGRRILQPETLDLIARPRVESHTHGECYQYGLGVRTRVAPTKWGLDVGEFGWDGAAGCYIMADRKNKISVTATMAVLGWPSIFGNHIDIVEKVYKDIFGK